MSELAELYFEKALTAIRGRANDVALKYLVEAIKLKPNFVEAWITRGNVLHSTEQHFDALLHYDRALSIDDKYQDAWNNRGLAFADLGMWPNAEESFRRSLEILPALEPHMGLANMYCTIMRLEEAAAEYTQAIGYGAGPEASFNLGVTLLGLGDWVAGFACYEERWKNTPYPPWPYRNYPKWKGENLDGKRIILYPEQGYGDEIMAERFAIDLWERYSVDVIVLARGPMLRLAQACLPAVTGRSTIKVAAMNGPRDIAADFSCPLLDVPMVAKYGPQAVSRNAYMKPDDRTFSTRIRDLPPGLNVGLCWNSGGHLNTARAAQIAKSVPLSFLKPLAIPGVNLISLQKPAEPIGKMPITDWMDECHDFADTAALISELDLVISVDTAVAHLAGAMGKPVWNFVRFNGYWPWLAPEAAATPSRSIWYPSMKLLRQEALGDWGKPIRRATELLAESGQAEAGSMKTLVFDIKNPADGDLVIIEYSSPLGGCTSVKTKVLGPRTRPILDDDGFVVRTEDLPAQTPCDIATILARAINTEWMKEAFEAKVKADTGALVINNPMTLTPDVVFRASVAGNGGTKVDVTEF